MPISKYNPQFGGKPGAAAKALAAMQDEYGDKRGTSIFYVTKNRRKKGLGPRGRSVIGEPGARAGGTGVAGA